jgi:c-di-GMP-binding flagellar brake protein YcgR
MTKIEERRKFIRLNALTDVSYTKHPPKEKIKLSLAKNISTGGICLIVYEEIKKSEILDLKIYIPEGKLPVNAIGRVAWVKEFIIGDASQGKRYDVGIEFIKIKKEDIDRINKYVFNHIK